MSENYKIVCPDQFKLRGRDRFAIFLPSCIRGEGRKKEIHQELYPDVIHIHVHSFPNSRAQHDWVWDELYIAVVYILLLLYFAMHTCCRIAQNLGQRSGTPVLSLLPSSKDILTQSCRKVTTWKLPRDVEFVFPPCTLCSDSILWYAVTGYRCIPCIHTNAQEMWTDDLDCILYTCSKLHVLTDYVCNVILDRNETSSALGC